ncbi:MAG TPA: hypothetical protein VH120_01650 [Gemmataceae bacterium]|nr:hypothetical protein [Gemmataceae bacterium]
MAGCFRRVLNHERDVLGHIKVIPGRWFPWPQGRGIAAYEEPDSSLLFTAQRVGWLSPTIVVADADGTAVAFVHGQTVSSPTRKLLARRDHSGGRPAGRYENPAGAPLVRWEAANGGTLVRFVDQVRNEPFLKMGLLAAIVTDG